jgi:hypothetical protein
LILKDQAMCGVSHSRPDNFGRWLLALAFLYHLQPVGQVRGAPTMSATMSGGKSGMSIQLTSNSIVKSGYRAVQAVVTRSGAPTTDREVVLYLTPNDWPGRGSICPKVRVVVQIPQGSNVGTGRALVPYTVPWSNIHFQTFVDGVLEEDLTGTAGITFAYQTNAALTESFPGWLVIDSRLASSAAGGSSAAVPSTDSSLLTMFGRLTRYVPQYSLDHAELAEAAKGTNPALQTKLGIQDLETVQLVAPSDLATNWLEYTPFDIAVISLADLEMLIGKYPERWQCLERFLRSGGNLVVYGVGSTSEPFSQIGRLEALVGLEPSQGSLGSEQSSWQLPSPEKYGASPSTFLPGVYYQDPQVGYQFRSAAQIYDGESEDNGDDGAGDEAPAVPQVVPRAATPCFAMRHYDLGRLIAISSPDVFSEGIDQWDWLLASLGTDNWKWYQRHGLSLNRKNDDFWNMMIEGVGAAPVMAFLILISGFVLVIGPVNYFGLRRTNRLYLLLFTVPLGALLVTLGLIAYAFLGDGLGTRLRARSYTLIDSQSGRMVSWSRQTYYAGISLANGLAFPADSAVYPIEYKPYEADPGKTLLWSDDEQRLLRGYIQPRSLAQFLVIHPGQTAARITIKPSGGGVVAENHLNTHVSALLVFDPGTDSYYWGQNLSPASSLHLQMIDESDARQGMFQTLKDQILSVPPGFDFPDSNFRRYRYGWSFDTDTDQSAPTSTTSLLERGIAELNLRERPKRRVYFAITTQRPDTVPIGIDEANEESGFHVIKGTW